VELGWRRLAFMRDRERDYAREVEGEEKKRKEKNQINSMVSI
jgi:hypothetical protein